MNLDPGLILPLIELIYASVQEPAHWREFLERFTDATGGLSAALFRQSDLEPRAKMELSARIERPFVESFERYYGTINPWMLHRPELHAEGVVATSAEMCPAEVLRRSPYYHEWLVPQGLEHALGATVLKNGAERTFITSMRSRDAGEPRPDDVAILRTLLPHLQRGTQLYYRLLDSETQRAATEAALEHLSIGVLLVDRAGRVLLTNRVAREILELNDGLTLRANRLRASRPRESDQLECLVTDATSTLQNCATARRAVAAGGVMPISRPSGLRSLSLLVAPLHPDQYRLGSNLALAAAFVSDPERQHDSSADVLCRLHGLTPAEAELAAQLAAGRSLEEAAEARSITTGTARVMLKSIFSKTGVRRQAELVKLLLSGVGLIEAQR